MTIMIKVHANDDDALIAWQPSSWPEDWVGFKLEKRNNKTSEISVINNRVPAHKGSHDVPEGGISSEASPIRRCIWTDHSVDAADDVSYRVTPMKAGAGGAFVEVPGEASAWSTRAMALGGDGSDGVSACFNRGTLMSQVVSRFVDGDVSVASLKKLKASLVKSGFPARRYLSGQARHCILSFLADADQRGNEVYAALYEINDPELIEGLKALQKRAHVLIGNGSSTGPDVANDLEGAHVEIHHRDLSHKGASSPSVHNKFLVEVSKANKKALRVLTGSTNWTTTGLCTQLNNVLVVERPKTAERFLKQWHDLVKAEDDLPASLVDANGSPTDDGPVTTYFSATHGEAELKPALKLIDGARDGLMFLMFKPGQSPLLSALLDRGKENKIYVRGVVSDVGETETGKITHHDAHIFKNGIDPKKFHESAIMPMGIGEKSDVHKPKVPSWAKEEFTRKMFFPAGLMAIVHSKVIIVDPFSDDCAVITGSHNFSDAASKKNDENLVIVRGNKALAQAYAVHMEGVYDHYSWRAFLQDGGDPDKIFEGLEGWKKGSRANELKFWLR